MAREQGLGCLVSILNFFGWLFRGESGDGRKLAKLPFRRKDYLLTQAERAFFVTLQQAVGQQFLIFAKVRALDLIWMPKGTESRQAHQNRVQAKHVDFVLCSRDVVRPLVVIELDDSSHESDDRRARDVLLDNVFRAAGLPLVRFACRASYRVEEIRARIASEIESGLLS
jgi:hypothetical protein